MAGASFLQTGTIESYDGHPIYYEIHGEGEPLLLIYGLGCVLNHWHHQIAHFRLSHKVVVFDLRGHHKSQTVPARTDSVYTIGSMAKDVLCLIKKLKLRSVTVAAHSLGAPIAIEAIKMSPVNFDGFISINGFFSNPLHKMFGLDVVEPFFVFMRRQHQEDPIRFERIWKSTLSNPITIMATTLFGGFNFKLTHFKDMEIYGQGLSVIPLPVFSDLLQSAVEYDGAEALEELDLPAAIIGGEKDHVTPVNIQKEMHQLLKGSALHLIPYGSHCTQLDFPDYVNLIMADFMTTNKKKQNA